MEKSQSLCYTENGGDNGMPVLKYTFMNDTLFKMLFVKHPDLLKKLVAAILKIPFESIEKFTVRNPEMPPESLGDKFCRLDINMEVDSQWVDLEIQVADGGAVKIKAEKKRPSNRKGKRKYNESVIEKLRMLWMFFRWKCGKILAPLLRQQMSFISEWTAFGITEEIAEKLIEISPSTIDRSLKKDKQDMRLKGKSLTKPMKGLKSRIPIRTFYSAVERKTPGFWQIDTVHHCGDTTSGQYIHTLTLTDVFSGWIELYSLLNNAQKWTFESLSHMKSSTLLLVLEFHSDNGSEFINDTTEIWCRNEHIAFTRSRSRKKNDNCFVEQKNRAVVREYVGYYRLEGYTEQEMLADIYLPLIPLLNFFMPTQKLVSKTRIGSKEIKKYDEPKSPYQRLIESPLTPENTKKVLREHIALYNPVELQDTVNKAILRLMQRLAQPNRKTT